MKLRKNLSLVHVFSIAAGAMISSGLFVLPGLAHARAGPAVIVSYLLAGVLAACGLLSVAELTTAMPKAGADYFFVSRSMGAAAGTIAGLLTWFSLSLKSAFALVGLAAFAQFVVPVDPRLAGAVLAIFFIAMNMVGVREAARLQVALVCVLFALMAWYVVRGLPAINVTYLQPFAPLGLRAVFATAGFVFVSYGGLLKVASIAEEVDDPGRVIPRAMILALVATGIAYVLMIFITSGVLSDEVLNGSLTPISDGAAAFMGSGGRTALGLAAILAFLTTANGGIMAASRYLLAMGRDGLVPEPLAKVAPRSGTPLVSLMVTGVVVVAALFMKLGLLVQAASVVFMMTYILANAAVIVLRESGLQNYRPRFRAPGYPWLQIAGIVGIMFVLLEMGEGSFAIVALLVVAGFCVYWFYGRTKPGIESALLHVIHRIAAKELVTGSLDAELKEVIRERDNIVRDRFDAIIEDCVVLDIDDPMSCDQFFGAVSKELAPRVGMDPEALVEALRARERETSTVLAPGLAIPHVIVEGEGMFDILMARSRAGVTLSESKPPVHIAFVMVGTVDNRDLHLRALSAIAQVVQSPGFEQRWMGAKSEQELKDIVLLAERRRPSDA
ncbi:MAG: amino acid permease [Candidatus Eisenbacteria bacterium]|nr:amino acid permease [Candidatus Eisenbacteria bacterium]